eukprot:363488-Chlamydomonas_euryale.AAC.6
MRFSQLPRPPAVHSTTWAHTLSHAVGTHAIVPRRETAHKPGSLIGEERKHKRVWSIDERDMACPTAPTSLLAKLAFPCHAAANA